ncbi:MAG: M48 family metallopeptidase [Chloroflexi bacterium]|nr:M48 family metallopeptidase [Chloroflexota bacterium]
MPQRKKDPPPGEVWRQVPDGSQTLTVQVTRDRRLRSSVRWTLAGDTIQVRVPPQLPADRLESMLDEIVTRVLKQRTRARRLNDDDLEQRARQINRRYFDGELSWHTIRWVNNMAHRLGSCTSGGATDGDIRLSDRIRHWPAYVLDYVLAHELAHRKYPNHSADFWAYLARYPHTERARGFIEGIAYAQGDDPDSLI